MLLYLGHKPADQAPTAVRFERRMRLPLQIPSLGLVRKRLCRPQDAKIISSCQMIVKAICFGVYFRVYFKIVGKFDA